MRVGEIGALGHGFVAECPDRHIGRVIVTAAHCLPCLPPAHPGSYIEERTFANLVGPLDDPASIWAECLFVDPIADVAVLGSPDDQALSDQADAFGAMVEARSTLAVVRVPQEQPAPRPPAATLAEALTTPVVAPTAERVPVRLFSLDGSWLDSHALCWPRWLSIEDAHLVKPGMSGSPIITQAGAVLGVVSNEQKSPRLSSALPLWMVAPH